MIDFGYQITDSGEGTALECYTDSVWWSVKVGEIDGEKWNMECWVMYDGGDGADDEWVSVWSGR